MKVSSLLSFILFYLIFGKQTLAGDVQAFNCGQLWDYNSDTDAKIALENAIQSKERIGLGCISTLISKNFYSSAEYLFDTYYKKRNLSQKAIYEFRSAMKNTSKQMDELEKLAKRQQTHYLERSPPTKWAQSLDDIEMEVKFSLRHGVPGCINAYDLNINFTRDSVYLSAFCIEGGIKMKYVLDLQLWGTIDPEESEWEQLGVGEISITLAKDPHPGRWLTLCLDEKPDNLVLWFEKHQTHAYRLEEFEDDEIWEYEGWDIENEEDDEDEDRMWNKPIVRKSQQAKKLKSQVEEPDKPKKNKPKKKSKKSKAKGKKSKKGKDKKAKNKKTKKVKKVKN